MDFRKRGVDYRTWGYPPFKTERTEWAKRRTARSGGLRYNRVIPIRTAHFAHKDELVVEIVRSIFVTDLALSSKLTRGALERKAPEAGGHRYETSSVTVIRLAADR